MATMLISLIRIFKLGPDVSLNGSPTVSPTTVALWTSLPLPPKLPSSTYFLALSHAPPAFAMKMASTKPLLNPPISRPSTPGTPKISPVAIALRLPYGPLHALPHSSSIHRKEMPSSNPGTCRKEPSDSSASRHSGA